MVRKQKQEFLLYESMFFSGTKNATKLLQNWASDQLLHHNVSICENFRYKGV